jgi:hypothetical protein
MVFSYIISPDDDDPAKIYPSRLSCASKGLINIYIDKEMDIYEPVDIYTQYLGSGIENTEVRWTEPYVDAFGLGYVITGSRPIYEDDTNGYRIIKSVIAMDVLYSDEKYDKRTIVRIFRKKMYFQNTKTILLFWITQEVITTN